MEQANKVCDVIRIYLLYYLNSHDELYYVYVYMIMDLFPTPLSKLLGLEDVRGKEL